MSRLVLRAAVAAAFLQLLTACTPRNASEPVVLGQLAPRVGPRRAAGEHARQGAALAVKVAREGGKQVLGREVVVRHVDSRGGADAAQAEAVRLLKVNKVAGLLGGPDPEEAVQTARSAQPYEVPLLVTADVASLPVGEAAFTLTTAPVTRGALLARFAAQDLRAVRAAVLTDARSELSQTLAAGFGREWRRLKATPPEEVSVGEGEDQAKLPERVARGKPDVLLVAAGPEEFGSLRERLAAAGMKGPILYGGEDRGAELKGEAGDVYAATVYAAGELSVGGREFARRYEEEYREPPDLAAAQAYDGVGLLIDALNRSGGTSPARVREVLAGTEDYSGVTGPLGFKDRRVRRNVFVVRFRSGSAAVVRTFGPDES